MLYSRIFERYVTCDRYNTCLQIDRCATVRHASVAVTRTYVQTCLTLILDSFCCGFCLLFAHWLIYRHWNLSWLQLSNTKSTGSCLRYLSHFNIDFQWKPLNNLIFFILYLNDKHSFKSNRMLWRQKKNRKKWYDLRSYWQIAIEEI